MLKDILKAEYIKINEECKDWEDAIRHAGNILLEKNIVTEEYIDTVIKSVKLFGPYVVVAKGIAIPHCLGSMGVKENAITLITLKNPVNFGNPKNDPVYYVLLFANTDFDSHIEALSAVSELLQKTKFFEVMKNAKEPQYIIDYINKEEINNG